MHHFFVTPNQIGDTFISLTGSDVNHIKNVLRMKLQEEIMVSNGSEKDYHCKIHSITTESVEAEILSMDSRGSELPSKIYLFQGLPKSDKMELIIQKAVELGVYEIIPVATKRSVVKLDEKKEAVKLKRWNGIAESAAKQSMRSIIPKVTSIMSWKEAMAYSKPFELCFIPYELCETMKETKELIGQIKPFIDIGIFIGPEGGFDENEIAYARDNGVNPITLGKRILRTETAGLTILSVLMFQLEN